MTRVRILVLAALALAVAGCGSDDKRFDLRTPRAQPSAAPVTKSLTAKEPVTRTEAHVIRAWASQLRRGHVVGASKLFAVPAVVANGFPPVKVSTRKAVRQFNRLLPCGAVPVKLERQVHHLVLTTFRLVNRTGPGAHPCGGGGKAFTAFRIEHGLITQWYRVPDQDTGDGTAQSSS